MISQMASQLINQPAPFFLLGVDYASAQQVFTAAGQDLDALRAGANQVVPLEGATLETRVKKVTEETNPPNVVATLMGSDPTLRNEYVVFSAHMDHVGVGAPDASGDSIFNGADDDASGTATMLEVAEAFASLPTRPARSMIFLAVSGEEKGLLGSAAFAANPPMPIERMIANINLDMVGRNAPDSIIAIGNEYSSLGTLVQEVATKHADLGLTVAPDLWPEENLFFRSDHFNFAKAGVPAIFFTTGLHDEYHQQSDEVDLIDLDKISRVGRLVFHLAWEIATRPTAPTWTEKGITEVKPTNVRGR
jgi:Zn-dependent M28 family amino/carboxypeptidase